MKEVKFAINVYDNGMTADWSWIFLLKLSKMYWVSELARSEQWSVWEPEIFVQPYNKLHADYHFDHFDFMFGVSDDFLVTFLWPFKFCAVNFIIDTDVGFTRFPQT